MRFSDFFVKKIDSWIPPAIAQVEDQRLRARVILLVMAICSSSVGFVFLGLLIPAALLGTRSLWDGVFASLGVSLVWYGGIMFFRRTANLLWASHLFAFIMYSSTFGALLTSGGWSSPINSLLLAVPAGIFLVAGRQVGLLWAVIVAATYYFLWLLHINNISLIQIVRDEHRDYLTVGMWCFSSFIMISCMTVYDRMAEVLKESLRAEREQYRHRMMTDFLSGTFNRFGIQNKFNELLQRDKNILFLYFNIANLSMVNTELHYQTGDELIRKVAEACRDSLPSGSLVSRITGGEFLVLVPAISSNQAVEKIAQQLHEILSKPFSLMDGQHLISIESGIGAVCSTTSCLDFRQLLRDSHEAMQTSDEQKKPFVIL